MTKEQEFLIKCIKELYKIHAAGSALHIVLDDYNVGDKDIEYCKHQIDRLCKSEREKELCETIAERLLKYCIEDRLTLIRKATGIN